MINHIFRIVDMDTFQRLTYPISIGIYKQIWYHIGGNHHQSLTLSDLNNSYTIFKSDLGNNIHSNYIWFIMF